MLGICQPSFAETFCGISVSFGNSTCLPVLRLNRERECLVVNTAVLRVVTCISFRFNGDTAFYMISCRKEQESRLDENRQKQAGPFLPFYFKSELRSGSDTRAHGFGALTFNENVIEKYI